MKSNIDNKILSTSTHIKVVNLEKWIFAILLFTYYSANVELYISSYKYVQLSLLKFVAYNCILFNSKIVYQLFPEVHQEAGS